MTEHVMLDLETMGNGNNAAIVSIGAVKFTADDITDEFHVGVNLESSTALGLKIDADTVMWWLHPDRADAREELLKLETVDLPSALIGFSEWFGDEKPIWGNGSTFDNVILRSSYAACQMGYPARFWNDQCYRTLKYRAPNVNLVREGTHHNALDDARCQAKHLQAIMRQLGAADRHLIKLQDAMREYMPPDSGVSNGDFVNQIIGLLDGPEQREVQGLGPAVL